MRNPEVLWKVLNELVSQNEDFKNEVSLKISETQKSQEWKDKNYKQCVYCDRLVSPGNIKKHEKSCSNK